MVFSGYGGEGQGRRGGVNNICTQDMWDPRWSIEKWKYLVVNKARKKKTGRGKKNITNDMEKFKGCVVILYVKGLSESVARVMKNITR